MKRPPIPRKRPGGPRRGPLRSPKYLAFLRSHGWCVICGASGCDPAHGPVNGLSSKGPDNEAVPMCRKHHDQLDGHAPLPNKEYGRKAFEEYYQIGLAQQARYWWGRFQKGAE
jgi:hypothetical protein